MSLTIVSNSSTAMCATVNSTQRFFCHESFDTKLPLYLPAGYTFRDLVEADKKIALVAYSASIGTGWPYLRWMMCATEFKPCNTTEPPTDSGVCKSTCLEVARYSDGAYSYLSFGSLCADDKFVIDDTNPNRTVICAGSRNRASSTSARVALVGLVAIQALILLL